MASQPAVIPSQETLIGDLLSMDLNVPPTVYNPAPAPSPSVDLLASGIDSLVCICFDKIKVSLLVYLKYLK